jgi:hypothetical protein
MRRAISGYSLAGMVQNYGVALRWAGAAQAPPPRSLTEDEQRALVPQLAGVALDLAERGLLTVHEGESHRAVAPVLVTGPELQVGALAEGGEASRGLGRHAFPQGCHGELGDQGRAHSARRARNRTLLRGGTA